MAELKPGQAAPDFNLVNQDGKSVALADYKGRKLLLYFYPKADTPGCTTQACQVRDALPDFQKLGIHALGISPDPPEKQKKFDGKHGLGFPLLADADHRLADAYGTWGEKSMYGKKYLGIIRSSFLIDEQGKIIQAWYKINPKDTVAKALQALK